MKSSVKKDRGSVKSSVKSSVKILEFIAADSQISAPKIAMALGISTRAVEKQLRMLRETGVIRRVGPDKGGHWEVIDSEN